MKNILVTGGSGFVGSKLISHSNFSGSTFVGRSKPKGCKNYIKFDLKMIIITTFYLTRLIT